MGSEVGKLCRDPLCGPKVLSRLAVTLIDTPESQRSHGPRRLVCPISIEPEVEKG
jgi:hypothetical protein